MRVYKRMHCYTCDTERLFSRSGLNHGKHLVLALCSMGVWSVVWAILAMRARSRRWHCGYCGAHISRSKTMLLPHQKASSPAQNMFPTSSLAPPTPTASG